MHFHQRAPALAPLFPHVLLLMNAHTHNVTDFSSAICKAVILLCPSAPSVPLSFPVLDLMTELNSTVRQSTLNYNALHTPVQQWNWPSHILQLLPLDIAKCNYGRKYMGPSYSLTLTLCCINFIVSLRADESEAYQCTWFIQEAQLPVEVWTVRRLYVSCILYSLILADGYSKDRGWITDQLRMSTVVHSRSKFKQGLGGDGFVKKKRELHRKTHCEEGDWLHIFSKQVGSHIVWNCSLSTAICERSAHIMSLVVYAEPLPAPALISVDPQRYPRGREQQSLPCTAS